MSSLTTEFHCTKGLLVDKRMGALRRLVTRLRASRQLVKAAFGRRAFAPFEPLKQSDVVASLSVVAIVDEFSESCFRDEWRLTLLSKRNWRSQIAAAQPTFLFVESAWRGNGNQWRRALTRFNEEAGRPLRELLAHCREIGLPTVFWNKEDPPNFDKFKDAAAAFDWVFTTDADCIPRYREHCGHDRVFTLPFAAQPRLHNPAGRQEDMTREIAFAGSWFAHKYPARQRSLSQLLDAAIGLDLKLFIFDRCSELKRKARARHRFPPKYAPYIHPKLPYEVMLSAYRMFPIFLNVNSVTKSPTMFSRRVFELLACGTNVVSSPSQGMEALLPGAVATASTEAEARAEIMALLADPAAARRRAHKASRMVLRDHTYSSRAEQVVRTVVPAAAMIREQPLVSVVLTTNRPERLEDALENYRRQTYPRRELLLALNSDRFEREAVEATVADIPEARVFDIPEEKTLAACLNHVLAYANGTYWARFDDDGLYGMEYISDALLPFDYTDAKVVGKGTYFARISGDPALYLRRGGNEHKYTDLICGRTLIAEVPFTRAIGFNESLERGCHTDFLKRACARGGKIYSADPFNFIEIRELDVSGRTWNVHGASYLKSCEKVAAVFDEKLVFI